MGRAAAKLPSFLKQGATRALKPDNIFLTYPDVGAPLVGARDVGAGLVPPSPSALPTPGGHKTRPYAPPASP